MATDARSTLVTRRRADADVGDDAVALAVALVGIDSVNPGLIAGAAGEHDIVGHLRDRLLHSGFETHVVTPRDHHDRPSLVAVGPEGAPGPTVVLTGHLDTVGVDGMDDPFAARVEGDRLLGRGAADMKGGVAALVVAAEELAARATPGRVVLALVADEEDAGLGTEAVLEALPGLGVVPDVAVVGEPTWLALAETLRGYALVEVTLTGRAAHSSQPELGTNAVAHLGRLLTAVEARDRALPDPGGSLMVTMASGGESPFVLARSATALVERRTVAGESSGDARAEVEEIVDDLAAHDPSVTGTARLVVAREPWRLDTEGPAAALGTRLEAALAAGDPLEGTHDGRFHAPYWMEAPLWQAAGIPALVCGPAGGGLHAADEWVDLRQVRRYALALIAALAGWVVDRAD
ncbi:MAG TPA: M20/M25/M40 family metallo-hydrolase [Ornithinibacter sp.]|nr:M20/M25/M40 family metallo-hydrolase [Ornithinibacter sp.]